MSFLRKMLQSCVDYSKTAKALNTEAKIAFCGVNTDTNLGKMCGNVCGCICVKCLGCSSSVAGCITKNKSCSNVTIREQLNARQTGQRYGANTVAAVCCFCGCAVGCCCCPVEAIARGACKTDAPICNPYSRAEHDGKNLFWTRTCFDEVVPPSPERQEMPSIR